MGGIKNKLNKLTSRVKILFNNAANNLGSPARGAVERSETEGLTIPLSDYRLISPFSQRGTKSSLPLAKGRQMSVAHRWGRITKYLGIACLSLAILSTLVLNIVSSYSSSNIESNAEPASATLSNDATALANSSSLSMSFSNATGSCTDTSNPANVCMEIPDGGGIATGGHTVELSLGTDNVGYTLTVSSKNDSTDLINNNNNGYIPTIEGDDQALQDKTWGIAVSSKDSVGTDDATWKAMSAIGRPLTLAESDDTVDSATQTVRYGVRIDNPATVLAGEYTADIMYSATVKLPPAPTISGVTPGQIQRPVKIRLNSMISNTVPGFDQTKAYSCYITDKNSVYCGQGYVGQSNGQSMINYAIGFKGLSRVNTDDLDGRVVGLLAQTVMGFDSNEAYTCYLTDKGKVYCGVGRVGQLNGENLLNYAIGFKGLRQIPATSFDGNVTYMISNSVPDTSKDYAYTCYLTDNSSVYCGYGYVGRLNGQDTLEPAIGFRGLSKVDTDSLDGDVVGMAVNTIDEMAYTCYITSAGSTYCNSGYAGQSNGQNMLLYAIGFKGLNQVNTSSLDGKVVKIVTNSIATNYRDYGYTCYLTDAGSVYCGSGYAGQSNGESMLNYAIGFKGLCQVDTSQLDGPIVDIMTNSIEDYGYTCYLTDKGSVYCSGGYGDDSLSTAIGFNGLSKIDASFDGKVVGMMANTIEDTSPLGKQHAYSCYATDVGSVYCSSGYLGQSNGQSMINYAIGFKGLSKIDPAQLDGGVMGKSEYDVSSRLVEIMGSNFNNTNAVYVDYNGNNQQEADEKCIDIQIANDKITCTAPELAAGTYKLHVVDAFGQSASVNITYN